MLAASSDLRESCHQHGRRLYGHGIQADRRRLRADRAAFLWSVNRTDQYFLQKSITGYFKRLSVLHGRCVAVHSRNPDGRTLGSYVDCRSSIDSLPGNGIGCGVYTLGRVLLAHNEVSKVAIFGFVNPLCSVVLSALVLGEVSQAFNARSLIALILVCVGIYIVNCKRKK